MDAAEPAAATALDMAIMEANALALGVSVDTLMENAGRAIAEEATRHLPPPPGRVAVLAGSGNNGGDGACAAFYLGQWGFAPVLWLATSPSDIRGASARRCWERAAARFRTHLGAPRPEDLRDFSLILDALLGSGQTGELRSPYREAVEAVNRSGVPVLSVDVPTGLGGPVAVRPRWTVALTCRKPGMDPTTSGEIVVRDIGIPEEARERTGPGEFLLFPVQAIRSSRGRHARLLIVGGGPYAGAPVLSGLAALRAGAERVTLAIPRPAADADRSVSPNLIVRAIGDGAFGPSDLPQIRDLVRETKVATIALGMGAGAEPGTVAMFRTLIEELRPTHRLLVDADGLRALADQPATGGAIVATPNPGEYARIFGEDAGAPPPQRLAAARERARSWRLTLLAKGEYDLITDGERAFLNAHHHPAATVSGVGDVLSGVVASLLAQEVAPLDAARLGAYWVGEAGLRAAAERSYSLVATDVIEELSAALVEGLRRSPG